MITYFHQVLKILSSEQKIIVHFPNGYIGKDIVGEYDRRFEASYPVDSLYMYEVFHMFTHGRYLVINLTSTRKDAL